MKYCVVLVTAPKGREAKALTNLLLRRKLCACVNIIRHVDSFFWWKSRIDKASESLLVIKTKRGLLPRLIKEIRAAHSYSVCEIIALPILAGNKPYLDWIDSSCAK